MAAKKPGTVAAYETEQASKPAWDFMKGLEGRNKAEAIALVQLLEDQGNALRRPQSGALGDGLFELRGKEVRLFFVFLPIVWRSFSMGRSRSRTRFRRPP